MIAANSSVHVTGTANENPARWSSVSVNSDMAKDSENNSVPAPSVPVSDHGPPASGSAGGGHRGVRRRRAVAERVPVGIREMHRDIDRRRLAGMDRLVRD